jgi:hypothetical protein
MDDKHWTLQEAAQRLGMDEIGLYELFLDGRLKPAVYFINPAPAKPTRHTSNKEWLDDQGYLKSGEDNIIYQLNLLWDLSLFNDQRLYNGNQFIIQRRLNRLKHDVDMEPRGWPNIFVQRGDDVFHLQIHDGHDKVSAATDLPDDARLVVRKSELATFMATRSISTASTEPPASIIEAHTEEPWLIVDPRDPTPKLDWYTPARYLARKLIKDDSTLLNKLDALSGKVADALYKLGFKKRGNVKAFAASTVKKAFVNVNLT